MRRLRRRIEQFAGPLSPAARISFVLIIGVLAFICQHWRLTTARQFLFIGCGLVLIMLLVRRAMWKRSLAKSKKEGAY